MIWRGVTLSNTRVTIEVKPQNRRCALLKGNSSSNPEHDELLHLALDWNEACSLKVRKIRLLQALDLPLDETHVFPKEILKRS